MDGLEKAVKDAAKKAIQTFFPHIEDLTSQQFEILKSIFILRKDTFAILPTGHGKSLPYQIASFVGRELGLSLYNEFSFVRGRDIVLVISPLLAIMDLQEKYLNSVGIRACCLHDDSLDEEEIANGKFRIIFGSPESWISERWRKVLASRLYQERVALLVADEAHSILSVLIEMYLPWGSFCGCILCK